MKKFFTLMFFVSNLTSLSFGVGSDADAILGTWYCEDLEKSTFMITRNSSGIYTASILKSEDPSYIGKTAMKEVKYNNQKRLWEGTIISVKRKKEMDGVFTLLEDGRLRVEGSILFFSKTFYWVRVK